MQGDASISRAKGIRRSQRDERPSSRVLKSERASTSRATGIRRPQRDEHPSRRVLKSDRERTEAPDGQRSSALRVRAASDAVPPRTPRSPLTRLLSAMTSAFDNDNEPIDLTWDEDDLLQYELIKEHQVELDVVEETERVAVSDIRYSHSSCSPVFGDGRRLQDTIRQLKVSMTVGNCGMKLTAGKVGRNDSADFAREIRNAPEK